MITAENFGSAKVLFVIFKRADVTHERCMAEWSGSKHSSIVRQVPGLTRWVQDQVIGGDEKQPDGTR
jgi:hypothetical protein